MLGWWWWSIWTKRVSVLRSVFIWREAGDVWCLLPVWNPRAVIWFWFTISSLVPLPCPGTHSAFSFFCVLAHSPDFFSRKFFSIFLLRDKLFCMAYVSKLGEISWRLVCTAYCHMALVFAVMHLYKWYFLWHLCILFSTFSKSGIDNRWNGPWYQHVLALCAFWIRAIPKGLIVVILWKFCVWCLCMYDLIHMNLCPDF